MFELLPPRLQPFHLEGLVAHKNVSIQCEAELPALEETSICLGMAAVWAKRATSGLRTNTTAQEAQYGKYYCTAHHSHRQATHTFLDRGRYCLHMQDSGQILGPRQLYCPGSYVSQMMHRSKSASVVAPGAELVPLLLEHQHWSLQVSQGDCTEILKYWS